MDVELSFPDQPPGSNFFHGTKRGTLLLTSYRVISVYTSIFINSTLFSLKWKEGNHWVSKCCQTFALWDFPCWRMIEENGWCFSSGQDAKANNLRHFYVSNYGQIAFLFQSYFPFLGDLCDVTLSQWSHAFFYDAIWSDEQLHPRTASLCPHLHSRNHSGSSRWYVFTVRSVFFFS